MGCLIDDFQRSIEIQRRPFQGGGWMPNILRNLVVLVLFILLGSPFDLYGEKTITLNKAVKTALDENPEMKAMKNSLSAQKAEIGVARSFLLPRIGFEEKASRTNNPPGVFMMKLNQGRFSQSDFDLQTLNNPQAATDVQTLLTINQPLFDPRAFIGLTMAKNEFSAQGAGFHRKQEETALNVVQAFLQVHTAKEYAAVAGKVLEDAKEHLRITNLRFQNGLGLYSDTLRAETSVAAAEQKIVSAGKNVAVAKRRLGLLLGNSEAVDIEDQGLNLPLLPEEYYTRASLERKDLEAFRIRRENARNNVKLAESRYLPVLQVGGSYQLNDPDRPLGSEGKSWMVAATLRWDLFDGTNREFERSKAQYKVKESEEQLTGLKQLISFAINEAYLGVEEARENTRLAKARLKSAEEGRRLVKSRYENSLSPLIDLLDVQVQLDQARADLVAKENQYLFSVFNLSYESGTILTDLKIE
jgi:outer membrane protein